MTTGYGKPASCELPVPGSWGRTPAAWNTQTLLDVAVSLSLSLSLSLSFSLPLSFSPSLRLNDLPNSLQESPRSTAFFPLRAV